MSLWVALVIVGQFLNAIVALIDKYVVTSQSVILRPFTYAFWISVLSAGSVVIFFFSWIPIPVRGIAIPSFDNVLAPSLVVFALALTAGYAYFTALLSLFTSLKQADASDVVPVVGGLSSLATFALGYLFLTSILPRNFLLGFGLLVLGTVLVSRFRFTWKTVLSCVHAGLMFGVHYIIFKALVDITNFDTAFLWTRLSIALVALSMLLIPEYWEKVVEHTRHAHARDGAFVLGNKVLSGLASIILLKAVEHGPVALVQALGGIQYLFLLAIGVCCGRFIAKDAGENLTLRDKMHKVVSIPLIAAGLYFLFV